MQDRAGKKIAEGGNISGMARRVNAASMLTLMCLYGCGASSEFAACAAGSSISQIRKEGLVAWYRFDRGVGSILHDVSGNNHHRKIKGAAWVKGERGARL